MLDREIDGPCGWQLEWLYRSYSPLRTYIIIASYSLSLMIIGLGIAGFLTIRRSTKKLVSEPSNRSSIFNTMNKKVLRITRGHFWVAQLYLLNVIVVIMVDTYICFISLKKDAAKHPEVWTPEAIMEIAIYSIYLLTLFLGAFTLFPLLQMLLAASLLTRFKRHHNLETLIPEARFFSTHTAQIWAMLSFFVVSWWPPVESDSTLRYVVVQACFGSALAWLEASFAFNYHSDKLQQEDLDAASGGVRQVLVMFGKTVRSVHTLSEKAEGLPQYEDVANEQQALLVDEKAGN
jgi:uncharacterized membrane protein YhaH (DUF805 family)